MIFLAEHAKLIGLLFFFTVFIGVAWRTYRPAARQRMQQYAMIPLKEETHG